MAAQSIGMKRKKPVTTVTRKRRPTKKQENILTTKQSHPDLNTVEIATLCNTDHSHVVKTLQRYGIDYGVVPDYEKHRAQIFSGMQHRLLSSITDEDIQKTPAIQRLTGAAILYDKERLERGQSTEIHDVNIRALLATVSTNQDGK